METTLFVTKEYLEKQFKSFNNTLVKPNDKKIKEWLTALNGDVDVEGSIANTIAKKIASVISGAPEDYDTLKEISDWISSHSSNAEEMLAKIEANKEGILSENEKIELVEGIISTLNGSIDEEGSIAKMLKDAINTSVDNIIICESENEDIDFSKADWLKGEVEPVVFNTSDIVGDKATITSYEIPEGVTEIGNNTFSGCTKLESVTLPSTLTKIGSGAFSYTSLKSVVIPASVTEIGDHAFSGCSSLTSIDIPEGVTKIGSGAFYGCTSLTSITIPASVTEIGNYAFQNCTSLKSVVIPASVTEIEYNTNVFHDWSIVTFEEGSPFKKENGMVYNPTGAIIKCIDICTKLESVTLPSTLTKIGSGAFYGCKSLATINYTGTEEQWNAITKDSNWNGDTPSNMRIIYNYQG